MIAAECPSTEETPLIIEPGIPSAVPPARAGLALPAWPHVVGAVLRQRSPSP
jgi:hypothetical protein